MTHTADNTDRQENATMTTPHELHRARFEMAALKAHGTIAGWMLGKGQDPPNLTDTLKVAYERAFAVAFDSGYAAAQAERSSVGGTTTSSEEQTHG